MSDKELTQMIKHSNPSNISKLVRMNKIKKAGSKNDTNDTLSNNDLTNVAS